MTTGYVDICRDSQTQRVLFNSDAYNACIDDYAESCNYEVKCPSYFQLPVILLLLITVLNDGTLISVGYDRAKPSPRPEKWNLRVLFTASSVLGLVSMGTSLLMLWAALDSPSCGSLFEEWGLPVPAYGQIVTMIYLKVSLSDFLTLFAARTSPGGFWSHRPGVILFAAATRRPRHFYDLWAASGPRDRSTACRSRDSTSTWTTGTPTYNLWPLWVWIYCIVFFFVQDLLKVDLLLDHAQVRHLPGQDRRARSTSGATPARDRARWPPSRQVPSRPSCSDAVWTMPLPESHLCTSPSRCGSHSVLCLFSSHPLALLRSLHMNGL